MNCPLFNFAQFSVIENGSLGEGAYAGLREFWNYRATPSTAVRRFPFLKEEGNCSFVFGVTRFKICNLVDDAEML